VLGEFLRTRRDQAIISTKFGILASQQPLWKRAGKPVARAAVRKRAGSEITSNQFAVATFEHSLNESLRKLRTDYVDLLFMHESTESVLSRDDLLLALEKLVTSGKVRVEGISAAPSIIKEALLKKPRPSSLPSSRSTYSTFRQRPQLPPLNRAGGTGIANHPFGGVAGVQQSRAILREFASTVPAELRAKLGDVGDSVLSDVVLNLILTTPGIQVVIPAMMRTTQTSVVNSDLRVHGLDNLYRASSSVFRTTGQANSTLPTVAFGLRLVHHLCATA
jgi:aryl-alcohol dehydrogenase-like predicted oxidoreductase